MRRASCQHERLLPFARGSLLVRLSNRIVPDSIPSEQMRLFYSNHSSFFVSKSEHCHNELVASFDSGPLKCCHGRPPDVCIGRCCVKRSNAARQTWVLASVAFRCAEALPCGNWFVRAGRRSRCDQIMTGAMRFGPSSQSGRRRALRLPQPELQRAETMGELFLISFGKDRAVSSRAVSCASGSHQEP
jgi:hypothetical protein